MIYKTLLSFFLLVLYFAFSNVSCHAQNKPESFTWLEGEWERTNEADGKTTYEKWIKKSETLYMGEGITLKGKDTTFHEVMKLWKTDEGWSFDVQMPSEKNPTIFKVTQFSDTSFSCENPKNEFPKVIKYVRDGEKLKAEISAGNMKVEFEFRKLK